MSASLPAHAVLLDRGPQDPTLVFPQWYRDLNGLALKTCLSTTPSPNPGAAGKALCFPLNPDPAGFAGNVGPEVFYNDLNVLLQRGNAAFALRYVAALEGSYLPLGVPVHGTETVFGRIRVTITTQAPGVYKVTHPFGVEVFNVGPNDVGPRAVFFTSDIPLAAPGNFDGALNGRLGPFMQWDFVDPGLTLNVTNAAGAVEQFVGDPNLNHTFTGSPFGTNFVRVDGPAGSNLDGVGNDFIQSPLANVLGQKWLTPIPTPLTIKRCTYTRDPVKNVIGIDVYAKSAPGSQMLLTGAGMPSLQLKADGLGSFYGHVEMPATSIPPASVTVTNATSVPPSSVSAALVDAVNITSATYDSLTGALSVAATSSDLLSPQPAMTVEGPLGGPMTAGAFSAVLPAGTLPPLTISVASSAGGFDTDDVLVLPGLPMNPAFPPVAIPAAFTSNENTVLTVDLTASLTLTPPATIGSVAIVTPAANGTATWTGAGGLVTYTPNANFFGADAFQYVAIDSSGAVSNVGTVNLTVVFVPVGPTANADDFALVQNRAGAPSSRTVNVLANDLAAAGTTINPASLAIAGAPAHGTAVANADGTVTYTPVVGYVGLDSYQYRASNGQGIASNAATVTVFVQGGTESLSISKANYTVSKSQWNIVGSTNWFGSLLTHTTVTCYVGSGLTGLKLGTVPVDAGGKFALVPPPLSTPPPDATNRFTCVTSNAVPTASGYIVAAVTRI